MKEVWGNGEITINRPTPILDGAALLLSAAAGADPAANPAASAPGSLVLYFNPGSATVRQEDIHCSIRLPGTSGQAPRL